MRELKISLGTGKMRAAKLRAGKLAGYAYEACNFFLQTDRLKGLAPEQRRSLLKKIVLQDSPYSESDRSIPLLEQKAVVISPVAEARQVIVGMTGQTELAASGPYLYDTLDAYCAEKRRIGAWTEKTTNDFIPKLHFFVEQTGNIPLSSLRRDHIRNFKGIIDKLPARYGFNKEFNSFPLQEIMSGVVPLEKRMTSASLSKYYGVINSFLIWIQKNYDGIAGNIKKILCIKISEQPDLLRSIFTTDDIASIFSSEEYKNYSFNAEYKYWLPLIAHYTGMRIEEISLLSG
jgi:hypothetical protein